MNEKQENTIRLKKQGRMGDGRILEWTAGFIDTLSAVCRLPVQGNQTEIAGIPTEYGLLWIWNKNELEYGGYNGMIIR